MQTSRPQDLYACHACTLDNEPGFVVCSLCETPRPVVQTAYEDASEQQSSPEDLLYKEFREMYPELYRIHQRSALSLGEHDRSESSVQVDSNHEDGITVLV